jgi:CubicO group peptidase (beta-lactamase class C family)
MFLRKALFLFLFSVLLLQAQTLPVVSPETEQMNGKRLQLADQLIEKAIADSIIPGAVLLVARNNKIVYRKAYGYRQLVPVKRKMEINTIFDMASVTKPVATATSAMILLEHGKIRLKDRVSDFLPQFKHPNNFGKPIRIIHLLTHTSGLPPYAPVKELKEKYGAPNPDSLIAYIGRLPLEHEPGTYFKYSCLNFITLQNIIQTITGQTLKAFSEQNIFQPLGMHDTFFLPPKNKIKRCAATEMQPDGTVLLGVVHDPLARVMNGGISGNAGLFSTADDLAIYSAMMLNGGIFRGKRILSKRTVEKMISVPRGFEQFGRALGWDVYSDYNSNLGDLFSDRAYGHTGYTGTSVSIDPESKTVIILLTNRVHPHDLHGGDIVRLRGRIANIVASSILN